MFYIQQDEKIVLFDEDKQKLQDTITFMPQYEGLEIKEVEEGYVIYDFELITIEEKEAKEAQKERERIAKLSMTRGDVFEALILAKGLTKPQIRAMIEQAELDDITKALYLNRFDEALEFYRGYPIFDMLGEALGITGAMLDSFFDTKDYHYLKTCKLTINATPIEATVTGAGAYPYGTVVDVIIECEGYVTHTETVTLTEDVTLNITLDEVQDETNINL